PRLGKIAEDELKKTGNPALTLPAEPDALAEFDCIILGDVSPTQLPLPERVRLEKYVADRGGALVLGAGERVLAVALAAGGGVGKPDRLLNLLPIQEPRVVQPAQGFAVTLTAEGNLLPFLQLDASADESGKRWAELPPHYWAVIGRAKPGAVPLATHPGEEP